MRKTQKLFLPLYTPSRADPKDLEAIFVQREKLADVSLSRLRASTRSPDADKYHLLFIGPRGSGKTHLVAILVHRLEQDASLADRLRIAWLPEDESTPAFFKFLLRICRALRGQYPAEFPDPPMNDLHALPDDNHRGERLIQFLLKYLASHSLLVVVENLDEVFRGLETKGQQQWRAFLQEHPISATLATSQQLTEEMSNRDEPFFGFFQIEYLKPLSLADATELLRKIAAANGKEDLRAFLETSTGRSRVRAIRHLSGGSHRVYVALSEFLTRESLDDLVAAFNQLLDELTPYYQERLRWLPNQQREIVEYLCKCQQTTPVKDLARDLFMAESTASSQLKQLRDRGYVVSNTVGREARYELVEPLMRLCIEVKENRREPIRLIVEFLRVWYDKYQCEDWLVRIPPDADVERKDIEAALADLTRAVELSPQVHHVENLAGIYAQRGHWEEAFELLRKRFRDYPTNPVDRGRQTDGVSFIRTVLTSTTLRVTWKERLDKLIAIGAEANALTYLGVELVKSLGRFPRELIAGDLIAGWVELWRELAREHAEFELPLRVYEVGIRYLQTQDERVFLDLLQEERKILQDALELKSLEVE